MEFDSRRAMYFIDNDIMACRYHHRVISTNGALILIIAFAHLRNQNFMNKKLKNSNFTIIFIAFEDL